MIKRNDILVLVVYIYEDSTIYFYRQCTDDIKNQPSYNDYKKRNDIVLSTIYIQSKAYMWEAYET